jgi:hypothetical protein
MVCHMQGKFGFRQLSKQCISDTVSLHSVYDLASNGAEKLPSANSTMRATASIIRIYLHQQKKSEGGPNFWRGRA